MARVGFGAAIRNSWRRRTRRRRWRRRVRWQVRRQIRRQIRRHLWRRLRRRLRRRRRGRWGRWICRRHRRHINVRNHRVIKHYKCIQLGRRPWRRWHHGCRCRSWCRRGREWRRDHRTRRSRHHPDRGVSGKLLAHKRRQSHSVLRVVIEPNPWIGQPRR